jgi:imidazolonepropionase-like amidohydrolase
MCAVALRAASAQQAAPSSALVIQNVTVINVETGARWTDQTVVVTGNRISAVGQASAIRPPAAARVVDGRGKFLIPGLWDTHVHALFNGFNQAMPYLAAIGITSVRDMASSFAQVADARTPREDPNFIAPRAAVLSGPGLDGVPPNFGPLPVPPGVLLVVTTPEQGRQVVNRLAAAHVDLVKVRNGLATDTYMAIADEAKRWGLPFDGHLPPDVNIVQASDAGQRVVEHLNGLADLCAADPAALRQGRGQGPGAGQGQGPTQPVQLNRARCEETARHLVRNGTWLTPTIGGPTPAPNPLRQFNLQIVQIAAQAGVPMLAGTDWPGINFSNGQRSVHQELAGLVEAGLTPQQALRTATVNPAILFKMKDQLGSVEQGKLADLLLLDADPLVDITNTNRIAAVVVDGKLIDAERRKKMRDDFAAVLKKATASR